MTQVGGVKGMSIEHLKGEVEVVVRLTCATAYEATLLYETLCETADSGCLRIDFEQTKNVKDAT